MSLATASSTLQQRLDDLRAKYHVPGASLAVLEAGDVTSVASGVLNLDTGVEATVDSLFQIGSITKVWTTTVIMRLVGEGLIELDAPLRTYIPDFRVADEAASAAVTIRHLLTHSSGIDGDNFSDTGRGDDALEKYVATCANLRLVHPVGATMSYCNTGFTLLGRVIEVVTGQVWDAVMQERLFAPLELTHTATLPEDVLRFRAAIGHIDPTGEGQVTAPAWGLPRTAGPPGGICSTAAEVVRFAQLHLSDVSLRAMQEQQVVVPSGGDGISSRYWGLGWSIFDWGGRTVLGHDGNTIGQAAFLRIVPDTGVAVALLTNGGDFLGLYRDLYAELLDVEMPAPIVPPDEPLPVDASLYAGLYEREGASFRVGGKDGGLVAVMTVTGLGSEMTPEPFELPLRLVREDDDLFVTQHPAAPGMWLPGRFVTLEDGSRIMHFGGRATPRTGD
ncbi:MAG TPA: serine hydrolase domain-containing protein [Gaiellaceae bacterium]|jgi:CubicO group peptidase (beta-lactamase class C family)|nr:serine hydrolase domain-containing protein [Gaiellaceae bacterium]